MDTKYFETSVLQKGSSFGNAFLNILKLTNFQSIEIFMRTPDFNELNSFECNEEMKEFVEWFSDYITEENCVTNEERDIYNHLKMIGELVPEEDLDALIASFCKESPSLIVADFAPSLEKYKEELEALESLEFFLLKHKKIEEEKKNKISNLDLGDAISLELCEIDNLNTVFNEALEKFGSSWSALRNSLSQKQMEGLPNDVNKINDLNRQIEENLSFHMQNDFKEVKPNQGLIELSFEGFWHLYKRLTEVREHLVSTVSKEKALKLFSNNLNKLTEKSLSAASISVNEFRDILCSSSDLDKLGNNLHSILADERDCLHSLQIQDAQNCSKYLSDRLERLSKIETILKDKKLYNDAFCCVLKRSSIVNNFKFEKLQECYQMVESYYKKFEERMNFMSSFELTEVENIDLYHKKMINDLNLKEQTLAALDNEISYIYKNIATAFGDVEEVFNLVEREVYTRLRESREKGKIFFNGSTRGVQSFEALHNSVESNQKILYTFQNKINKIRKNFLETTLNEHSKSESIWLQFMKDPANFVSELKKMEAKLNRLMMENKTK